MPNASIDKQNHGFVLYTNGVLFIVTIKYIIYYETCALRTAIVQFTCWPRITKILFKFIDSI